MGLTKPRVPVDETPINRDVLARILAHAPEQLILVGGQALAFWMVRFGIGPKSRRDEQLLASITSDVDFLGSTTHALALARALGARRILPDKHAMTALAAQVRITASGGLEHNIDVLHQIYDIGGLRKSIVFTRRVRRRALLVQLNDAEDAKTLRILHPFDVLASRIQNAAGLIESKGPHVVTQARWAVKVARHALEQLARARNKQADRPGAVAAEIFRLATSRAGRIVREQHAIEVADAIPFKLLIKKAAGFEKQAESMRAAFERGGHRA